MYKKSIVTFIDILDFKSIVNKSKAEKVNSILDLVKQATTSKETSSHRAIVFSDCVIRVRDIKPDEPFIDHLFSELYALLHAQAELIDYGILIRGGICYDDIHIYDDKVFGPGLIKAYELESKFAIYPRIILDPEVIQEFNNYLQEFLEKHKFEDSNAEIIKNLLKQGDDGMWFLNYAEAIDGEFDENEMYPIFLKRHHDIIVEKSANFQALNSAHSKYIWLANYHNNIITNLNSELFDDYEFNKSDLLIKSNKIPNLQEIKYHGISY